MTAPQRELPTSPHFRLETLGEGVYAAIAVPGKDAGSNAAIVDLGDATLVFDTFLTPAAARDLGRAAEQLTGRGIRFVVNSHWHNDHIHGNAALAEGNRALAMLSTAETRGLIEGQGAANLAEIRAEGGELAAKLEGMRLRLPDVTFDSRLTLHGTRRAVELTTYGGGHTASDAFLLLPHERIAFLGDLLFVRSHPWLGDGDPDELIRILQRIEALDIALAVPGHGAVGTLADCAAVREYVDVVGALVRALHGRGASLEEAQEAAIPTPFAGWAGAEVFKWNVEYFYGRLDAAKEGPPR